MHCLTVKSYLQIETDRFMSLVVLDIFSLMKNYLMLWDKKKKGKPRDTQFSVKSNQSFNPFFVQNISLEVVVKNKRN